MEKKIVEKEIDGIYNIILNRPKKINVIDEELVGEFQEALDRYDSSNCNELLITGAGEKGFCAGGDVVSVAKGVSEGRPFDFFFKQEYKLDQRLYRTKGARAHAHGIVMGGGMGVLMGCQSKILDPNSILAMPEVTIGFFPDVGASYFLQKLPLYWRLFLTLTGARITAIEAYSLDLVDFLIPFKDEVHGQPELEEISQRTLKNLNKELGAFEEKEQYLKSLSPQVWVSLETFDNWAQLTVKNDQAPQWIRQSLENYCNGSPVSKVVSWELFHWCPGKSISECFEMDLKVAEIVSVYGDFAEGVRALLIDKDKSPKWKDENIQTSLARLKDHLDKIF